MPKLKPLFIERNGYMWNEAGFKAVEQDKILHPTWPSCLTFSAAGPFGSIEISERGKGRHMADVGSDQMKLFATISILAIICLASSCEDSNDHSDNMANATNEVILMDDRSDGYHPQASSTQRQEPGPTNTIPETVHTNNVNYCIPDGYAFPRPPVSHTNNELTIVMYDENGLLVYQKVTETEATQYSDASTYLSERIVIDIYIRSDGATNTDTTVTHDRIITLYDGVGVTAMLLQHYTNNTEDVRQFTGYIYCASNDTVRISENRYNRIILQLGI